MIHLYFTLLLSTALGGTSKIDFPCADGPKYIQHGENITLNCPFATSEAIVALWFKQTPGEKPVLVASAVFSTGVKYHSEFNNNRFKALRDRAFTLNITHTEPSDSATYYCAVADYSDTVLLNCTILIMKGSSSSLYTVLQTPELHSVTVGGNTTLHCSVLTDASAGEHSVYWLRHGSGESPSGIIYTYGDTNSQCSRSSEIDSPTQSCVYKLPKTNLSLSDAGTYYCAVAVCGQILFGNGTKLDFLENSGVDIILYNTIILLVVSNTISMVVILSLCRKLHKSHNKDAAESHSVHVNQAEHTGALNYAALSFAQPLSSRRSRGKSSSDQPVYAQVKSLK